MAVAPGHAHLQAIKIMRKTIGLLLVVLLSCSKDDSINCVPTTYSDAYEYPIKPGTEEWIELGSHEARVQACMIPPETLEIISTGGLFESLLCYPFILDYGAWEKFQVGFEKLKSENRIKQEKLFYDKMIKMKYEEAKNIYFGEVGR